jgi:Cu/Ag efflux pump CusA
MADDSPDAYPKSVRLTSEEQQLLNDLDISFSDLAHEAIEKKKKKITNKTRQQKVQKALADGIFLIIGIVFIWTLNITSGNIVAIAIVASMGIGFCLFGGIGLYRGMKEEGLFAKK